MGLCTRIISRSSIQAPVCSSNIEYTAVIMCGATLVINTAVSHASHNTMCNYTVSRDGYLGGC